MLVKNKMEYLSLQVHLEIKIMQKKMVLRLKNNGFNNAREIGLNKYNLTQVAYNSYISIDEANNELIKIRKTMDESAWILIKNKNK